MEVIVDGFFPVVVEAPDEGARTLLNEAEARDCLDDAEQVRISLQTQQTEKEGVLSNLNEMLREKLDELENLQTLQYDNLLNAENLDVLSWSGDWNEESLECVLGEPGCSIQTDIVPEPATVVLLATGLFGIGLSAWRRREQEAD